MFGTACMINDINELPQAIAQGETVIPIVDNPEYFQYTNTAPLGILLPPYEVLNADTENQPDIATELYLDWLSTGTRVEAIAAIIAVLHSGRNIVFYVEPEDSMNFSYPRVFIMYMANTYGVGIGDGIGLGFPVNGSIDMDPIKVMSRLELLLSQSMISINDFCIEWPIETGISPSQEACVTIAKAGKSDITFINMEQCTQYVNGLISSYKQSVMSNKEMPLFRIAR